jgi:hypothetical protein
MKETRKVRESANGAEDDTAAGERKATEEAKAAAHAWDVTRAELAVAEGVAAEDIAPHEGRRRRSKRKLRTYGGTEAGLALWDRLGLRQEGKEQANIVVAKAVEARITAGGKAEVAGKAAKAAIVEWGQATGALLKRTPPPGVSRRARAKSGHRQSYDAGDEVGHAPPKETTLARGETVERGPEEKESEVEPLTLRQQSRGKEQETDMLSLVEEEARLEQRLAVVREKRKEKVLRKKTEKAAAAQLRTAQLAPVHVPGPVVAPPVDRPTARTKRERPQRRPEEGGRMSKEEAVALISAARVAGQSLAFLQLNPKRAAARVRYEIYKHVTDFGDLTALAARRQESGSNVIKGDATSKNGDLVADVRNGFVVFKTTAPHPASTPPYSPEPSVGGAVAGLGATGEEAKSRCAGALASDAEAASSRTRSKVGSGGG